MQRFLVVLMALGLALAVDRACAAAIEIEATPAALARAVLKQRVVLLGETHDNATQHALRADALRRALAGGARPALAFEQFDRDRQADIDRARKARPHDADYLIAEAHGDPAWNWTYYRPLVALALEYELPIVAANLSRGDAMRVATRGFPALFDARMRAELKLDALPEDVVRKQVDAVASGHCDLLPRDQVQPLAHAQIARDIVMARTLERYAERGVVLLAGNGHVRRDIGVGRWLANTRSLSIAMLERDDDGSAPDVTDRFDAYVITDAAKRDDPCVELEQRFGPHGRR